MHSRTFRSALAGVLLSGLGGFCSEPVGEGLNAVLWCQTSLEYDVLCCQAFKAATAAVEKGLADQNWTALITQTNDYQRLPPSIITDVDETLLDNSPYQAWLVKSGESFSAQSWQEWVREEKAEALPGAREFITFLKARGVKVFYVTNRTLKEPTLHNIQKALDPDATAENILCKLEQKGWGSDKSSRRALIAKNYRILVLMGDDYNDFAFIGKTGPLERKQNAEHHKSLWGTKWFILPNPLYGNWERSLYRYEYGLSQPEIIQTKLRQLNTAQ